MGFKAMRIKAGYTVLETARMLGVSPAAVYQWEEGIYVPRNTRLPQIAQLYNCCIEDLLSENDSAESEDRTKNDQNS